MRASTGRRPHFDPQEEIKKVILERGLGPGSPIPTETELMLELGISRGSLREALKGLQARGIVDVQHGRGTFVAHRSMDSLVDGLIFHGRLDHRRDDLTTASELVDIRDILESALVRQVAEAADGKLLAALDECVASMEAAARSRKLFPEIDRAFHEQLYSSLGNSLVIDLVRAFWDILEAVRPRLASGTSTLRADAAHHRRIVDCLRARDPEAASRAMHEHFRATHVWIQGRRGRQ